MELFDTHFHFDENISSEEYMVKVRQDLEISCKDFQTLPDRFYLLCAGGSLEGSIRAKNFAETIPDAYFSAGVHPHDADEYYKNGDDFSLFRDHNKLLAVGEIGLDYFYDLSDRRVQIKVLEKFLDLALQWNLPAMLHLRDKDGVFTAYDDAWAMLKHFSTAGGRFVIHCYAGDRDFAEKFLDLGGYFGVTGMYTFKAAVNIREVISAIPTERLLIETDSPYLAPVPFRGKVNTPGMVGLVAAALGGTRNMTPEAAADQFTANGKKFYRIKK